MRRLSVVLLTVFVIPTLCHAQQSTKIEIGTSLGATIGLGSGDTEFAVGLPSPSFIGWPAIYVTWFASSSLMLEPQFGIEYNNDTRQVIFNGNLQFGYLLTRNAYVAVNAGYSSFGDLVTSGTVGGGLGYRVIVKEHLAVRGEAGYRRWLCDGCSLNEITFRIGFGTALP